MYKCIFDNNTKELIAKFFKDSYILKIWPIIIEHLTFEHCFE